MEEYKFKNWPPLFFQGTYTNIGTRYMGKGLCFKDILPVSQCPGMLYITEGCSLTIF